MSLRVESSNTTGLQGEAISPFSLLDPFVLRKVLFFLPLGQHVENLRLVNRQWNAVANEFLTDTVEPLLQEFEFGGDNACVKMSIRRGWSEGRTLNRDDCIEELLQMKSCKCTLRTDCEMHKDGHFHRVNVDLTPEQREWYNSARENLRSSNLIQAVSEDELVTEVLLLDSSEEPLVKLLDKITFFVDRTLGDTILPEEARKMFAVEQDDVVTVAKLIRICLVPFLAKDHSMDSPSGGTWTTGVNKVSNPLSTHIESFFRFYSNQHDPIEVRIHFKQRVTFLQAAAFAAMYMHEEHFA